MLGIVGTLTEFLSIEPVSYYDLVLAFIPSAFVVAVLVGHLLSLSPRTALAAAAAIGALAMIDAIYLNPPDGSAGRPG